MIYNKIVCPRTFISHSIHSNKGKKILKNFFKELLGGKMVKTTMAPETFGTCGGTHSTTTTSIQTGGDNCHTTNAPETFSTCGGTHSTTTTSQSGGGKMTTTMAPETFSTCGGTHSTTTTSQSGGSDYQGYEGNEYSTYVSDTNMNTNTNTTTLPPVRIL